MNLAHEAASGPVQGAERMDALDALRGAALLGILLVNIIPLSGVLFPSSGGAWSAADARAFFFIAFLLEGKFYALFSFLFGVGFAVFIGRASARGADAVRLFKRRLTGLLIIGLVHTLFIWMGDILATYAVIGFALIPFIERDDRAVLRWTCAMLLLPVPLYALLVVLASLAGIQASQPGPGGVPLVLIEAANGFAQGSYLDIVSGNAVFTAAQLVRRSLLMFLPRVFGMFLLGYYAGRRGIFANLDLHRSLLRRVFLWGMAIGLPFSYLGALLEGYALGLPNPTGLLETTVKSIGVPVLSLGYAAGLCLLFVRAGTVRRAFAPAGQMALTNYILQSVAGIVVFYGIGLGLFGRVPLVTALGGAAAFFVLQMIGSRLWLARARFGPLEWGWRMFTYKRRVVLFT